MEKVLDIDSIFGDMSFVAHSRDGEEETTQISRAKRELSSRLATIFADDNAIVPSTTLPGAAHELGTKKNSGVTPSETIFSSAVYLYLSQNGQYISKGRVGAAIVRSNSLIFLVFYNSNKENLLCVPLGDGSIHKIDKQEKYCTVRTALKTFGFVCLNDDDEAKLLALLMILCSIKSMVLEVGTGDEVEIGSSIFYSSTKFTFDGTSIEVVAQQPSKHRVSLKSDSWMLSLLGLKRSGRRLTLLDDNTALAIHVNKVKTTSKKRKEDTSKQKFSEEELSQRCENLMTDVSNVNISESEASLHSEKNIDRDALGKHMDRLEKSTLASTSTQRGSRDSSQPSTTNSIDLRNSNDQQQDYSSFTDGSFAQVHDDKRYDHRIADLQSDKSDQLLTDYSALHRIVGVEIDRIESRLQMALERMVNGCMNSIKNEMIQIKETQELIMEKLEDLRNGGCR